MSHTTDLLDKYKTAHGIESDYRLAKKLGITQQRISNYRQGLSHADDMLAVVLADGLAIDRFKTIARIQSERAKSAQERAFWKRLATAAALLLTLSPAVVQSLGWLSIM